MTAQIGCLCFDSDRRTAMGRAGRHDRRTADCGHRPRPVGGAHGRCGARTPRHRASARSSSPPRTARCSRCAPANAQIRDLFLDADLIHADGMPLVFVSRLFHKTPLPERVARPTCFTTSRWSRSSAAPHVSARRGQGGGRTRRCSAPARFIPTSRSPDTAGGYLRRDGDEERIIDRSTRRGRTFSGSVSARRPNNRSPCAIATGCAASA